MNGRDPAIALLAISTLAVGLGVGCAARHRAPTPVPVSVRSPSILGQGATPTVPGTPPSGSSSDAFPRLPGTDRVYPSQDPRNHATPDAPEAFPLPGAATRSVVKGAAAESMDGNPAVKPVTGDPTAESLTGDAVAESVPEDAVTGLVDEDAAAEKSVAISPPLSAAWSVQLLASSSLSIARERAGALTPYFPEPPRVEPVAGLFKVRVGRCATRDEAETLRRKAVELGLRDAFVVPAGPRGETAQ